MKVKGFLGFFYDFFLPHARFYPVELHFVLAFRSPVVENSQTDRCGDASRIVFLCVFEDFGAGVVFPFHAYTLPQDGKKARDFLSFLKLFFLTSTPYF